ncbi:MAG TPA: NAD-dependent epimerase/dehydratase family protein [Vicinamibacterales bacterium]|nr:NAD-dependent epimerase/dehydratase family protein [Vicinamibacterales bacterium]
MRVLVTGGTGYLGRAIVRALIARGHEPIVFARRATSAGLSTRAIDGDVRDRAALVAAARACDALCHSAALVSIWRRDPREFHDVNVMGLENALVAAREAGLSRVVYTSSFLARPPAGRSSPLDANPYQRTKAAALAVALAARNAGRPIVILYPGVVYGPGVMSEGNLLGRLIADHLSGRLPGLIGPEHVWSFAWVDDVAAAHVAALERAPPGSVYELGGENLPQRYPFEILRDLRGVKVPRRIPYWLAECVGVVEEGRARLTGRLPLLTRGTVEIFRHDWPLDSAAAARDLGLRVTPVADGVPNLLAANRST